MIESQQDVLLANWRANLKQLPSAQHLDTPTLNDHIPQLLTELSAALRSSCTTSIPSAHDGTPPAHGRQRLEDGFEIEEVVAEYNILRGCIHDLADANHLSLQGMPFHVINSVLDAAVGCAVRTYAMQQALDVRHRRDEYLAFVAHDLRTPLNAIGLAARVLELALADGAPHAYPTQMLKTLKRNVRQLSGLVDKVLEESINLQTETGIRLQRRYFDLWPLVESLIHDLRPVTGTGTTLLINDVPEELVVYADASLLRRVFQNIITNAINYTPHGRVVISARALQANHVIECTIRDNGAGIAQGYLTRIFDKYDSGPEQSGGFGLGLAISKTFIDAHGGSINVESKEGAGSTFTFTLPPKQE